MSRCMLFFALAVAGCGPSMEGGVGRPVDGGGGGGGGADANSDDGAGGGGGDDGGLGVCNNPLDLRGCGCPMAGATRACYTGPAPTQGKGICRDGMQTCIMGGEFTA